MHNWPFTTLCLYLISSITTPIFYELAKWKSLIITLQKAVPCTDPCTTIIITFSDINSRLVCLTEYQLSWIFPWQWTFSFFIILYKEFSLFAPFLLLSELRTVLYIVIFWAMCEFHLTSPYKFICNKQSCNNCYHLALLQSHIKSLKSTALQPIAMQYLSCKFLWMAMRIGWRSVLIIPSHFYTSYVMMTIKLCHHKDQSS